MITKPLIRLADFTRKMPLIFASNLESAINEVEDLRLTYATDFPLSTHQDFRVN